MKYMGSKNRISKDILPILRELYNKHNCETYWEPFVGGCNLIDKIDFSKNILGSDNNIYLISMFKALQTGKNFPHTISREYYNDVRESYNNKDSRYSKSEIGWVGFMGSYNGRFFDGGYSGHSVGNTKRDYIKEQIKNTLQQIEKLNKVFLFAGSYLDITVSKTKMLIYCDIPYKGTKQYSTSIGFNYEDFYAWCQTMVETGHIIVVSENSMPSEFTNIWSKEVNNDLSHATVDSIKQKRVERLFLLC